jgi:hypothetical protein
VINSYATGSISCTNGSCWEGGFAGYNSGTISAAYSIGAISFGTQYQGGSVGGFVGNDMNEGGIVTSYWDTDTSGITNCSQGAGNVANDPGITCEKTMQLESGLPTGFAPSIWGEAQGVNGGLPYLLADPPPQ